MIGPLPLTLEACGNRIVTERLLAKAKCSKLWISHHKIAGDHCHLHTCLPVLVFLLAAALVLWRVDVVTLSTVGTRPLQGAHEFLWVINSLIDAANNLHHVYCLNTHAEIVLKKGLINNRAGDAH